MKGSMSSRLMEVFLHVNNSLKLLIRMVMAKLVLVNLSGELFQ